MRSGGRAIRLSSRQEVYTDRLQFLWPDQEVREKRISARLAAIDPQLQYSQFSDTRGLRGTSFPPPFVIGKNLTIAWTSPPSLAQIRFTAIRSEYVGIQRV